MEFRASDDVPQRRSPDPTVPDTPAGQEPSLQTTFAMDDDDTESVASRNSGHEKCEEMAPKASAGVGSCPRCSPRGPHRSHIDPIFGGKGRTSAHREKFAQCNQETQMVSVECFLDAGRGRAPGELSSSRVVDFCDFRYGGAHSFHWEKFDRKCSCESRMDRSPPSDAIVGRAVRVGVVRVAHLCKRSGTRFHRRVQRRRSRGIVGMRFRGDHFGRRESEAEGISSICESAELPNYQESKSGHAHGRASVGHSWMKLIWKSSQDRFPC